MDLEALINQYHNQLNENDLAIITYILENLEECQKLSIVDLSERCHTSKSSIHRLTKKLGFTGFSEFKYSMKSTSKRNLPSKNLMDLQKDDIEATLKLMKQADVEKIAKEMHKAERIFGFGTGWAQRNALKELSRNLMSVGKHMLILPAKVEFDLSMPMITKNDFVIIISLSGDTRKLEKNIKVLNFREVPILSVTSFQTNYLAQMTPYNLYYHTTTLFRENSHEATSFVTLHLVCDALYREYITYRKMKEKGSEKA
ncbi:MurR/RpiR family transcriptional regulator [Alkalibacterium indicireducens]|uniref:MurR/RpiR family transcriptional regulator n=1 Tax=Alkalibacterium indicireducens TaxID=398758 RepID=A0ABN1AFR3_9LACT